MSGIRAIIIATMTAGVLAVCPACAAPSSALQTKSAAPKVAVPRVTTTAAAPTGGVAADGGRYPFGTSSFWLSSIATAPVAANSAALVSYLNSTVTDRYGGVAAFNAHSYDTHLYTVTASTPRVEVQFSNCQGKPSTPSGLYGAGGQFESVPIPTNAVPAAGSDAELTTYSPSTDQLWEFWKASRSASGVWSACWGGRIDNASTGPGYFSGGFGAVATGLPNAGGEVRLSEAKAGVINHAISIAIPAPAVASNFSWPAQRSDGFDTNPAAMPEGSRLRLDPSIDVTTLGLTPTGVAIARAAQKYGFVVVDTSGAVSVIAEAVDQVNGVDPWQAVIGPHDYAVMKNFPWTSLQVVQKDWGKPAS